MPLTNTERIRIANEEIIGRGNLDVADDVFAPDYIVHAGANEYTGTAFVRRFIRQLRSAIPDIRVVNVEFLIQAGDTIAWQRTLSGTLRKALSGIPPSGKKVEWRDMMVSRFDGDKIAEEWAISELAEKLLLKLPRP